MSTITPRDRFEVPAFLESIQGQSLPEQRALLTSKCTELEGDLAAIREQIAAATPDDRLAKPDWWKRIQGARHVKGLQIQQLLAATNRITAVLKTQLAAAEAQSAQSLGRCFMLATRERVSAADYEQLLERAREIRADGGRFFIGKLYYRQEDGQLQFLTDFACAAHDQEEAEAKVLEQAWDPRLDTASCTPHFDYERETDDETDTEPAAPAETAGEAVAGATA